MTVASLLAQLDDVDSKLHDEHIIAVREEPICTLCSTRVSRMECGHLETSELCEPIQGGSRLHVRMSKKSSWNGHVVLRQDGHAHTEHYDYRVEASVV